MKLLWIEEEIDTVLSEFKTYLINKGYRLKMVSDASEAEALLAKEFSFDLILLDIRINPGQNEKWINLQIDGQKKLGEILLKETIGKRAELLHATIVFTNESWENLEALFYELGLAQSKYMYKLDAFNAVALENFIIANRIVKP
jgi:CheY-like chemotaxis protein